MANSRHDHTLKHNFSDTSSNKYDVCNSTENVETFLDCTRSIESRHTLFDFVLSLNDVNLERLHTQDKTFLIHATNKLFLKATLKFLRDSKRFL